MLYGNIAVRWVTVSIVFYYQPRYGTAMLFSAASIILLRAPFEVLLIKRPSRSSFMANAHVFPGGRLDETDLDLEHCAVRETLEEVGIEISREDLHAWAHWITPSLEPKRFDTQFFVAVIPKDQILQINEHEVTEAAWFTPDHALLTHQQQELFLPPPTFCLLTELSRLKTIEEVLKEAEHRVIQPILPKITLEPVTVLLPWDTDYANAPGESLPATDIYGYGVSRIVFGGADRI
jgi:8-oxo-dGTP pyrophosphatase MutT (NUDIX family)